MNTFQVPTIVVLPSSDDKGESSIPSDTRVKMLNGDGIRQPHALTNKQNLNCETPRLLREYRYSQRNINPSQFEKLFKNELYLQLIRGRF